MPASSPPPSPSPSSPPPAPISSSASASPGPGELAWLREVLGSNPLFSRVDDPSHREELVRAFRKRTYAEGELIIRFGERGDRFFVLEEGEAAVEVPNTQATEVLALPAESRSPKPGGFALAAASSPSTTLAASDSTALSVAATPQIVAASLLHSDDVRVDLLERGSTFGEVSLLYDVSRCASVRCVTPHCTAWSVDAHTFREHAKQGSVMLRSVFQRFASVRVHGPERDPSVRANSGGSRDNGSSSGSGAPVETCIDEQLMSLHDFVQAIEYSKGLSVWNEAQQAQEQLEQLEKHGEELQAPEPHDAHHFRRQLANLLQGGNKSKSGKKQDPFSSLSPHRLRLIFRLADSSGDQLLSFGEFLILHSLLSQPHSEFQLAFRLFDRNKNGQIERGEFIAAMRALAADRGEKTASGRSGGRSGGSNNLENDPLVLELFGAPKRRLRTEVELLAERERRKAEKLDARERKEEVVELLQQEQEERAAEAEPQGLLDSIRSRWSRTREWVGEQIFHERQPLIHPTASAPPSASGMADSSTDDDPPPHLPGKELVDVAEDDRYVLEYRTLSYEQFAAVLKRKVLPKCLRDVQQDLRAIDAYWNGADMPFSLSAMEDGFGSSLHLESNNRSSSSGGSSSSLLTPDNLLPQVTSAHIADSERALVRSVPWKNLLAGGIAGAVSRTMLAPIERLKLLVQLQERHKNPEGEFMPRKYRGLRQGMRQMYKEDGARGLFKGNGANILRIVPVIGLQFMFYDVYKRRMFGPWTDDESVLQRLVAGATAGMSACVVTYPLDTIRARLTLQRGTDMYTGITNSFKTIYRTEGMRGFYHGLVPSMAGVIPYVGLDFAVYETLKRALPRDEHDNCSRIHLFVCGGVAGVVGQTIAYPLDLVRRRMQVYGWAGSGDLNYSHNYHRGTFVDALRIIKHEEGYRGLYRGIGLNYLKVVPAVSIAFMIYERVRAELDNFTNSA